MRIVTLDINKKIVSVKNVGDNYVLGVNDIETDLGEIDQIMQSDGTFITPEPVPIEPFETVEQKLVRLEARDAGMQEDINFIYETLGG